MDAKKLRDGEFIDVVGSVFKQYEASWKAFQLNWQVFVGALAIIFGVTILGSLAVGAIISAAAVNGSNSGLAGAALVSLLVLVVVFVASLILAPLVITAELASARTTKRSLGEVLEASKSKILGFWVLAILSGIAIGVGLVLLVVPGLIVAFFLIYAPYIYMDRTIGAIDAMKASYELAKEYWKATVGIVLVGVVVSLIGSFPLIGGLASLALSVVYFCLVALVYVKITGKDVVIEALASEK